jgi:phosphohistidine phosphatase
MDLYILRHAIAEEHDASAYPDDSLRPLTTKGTKRMHLAAEGMRALDLSFDVIYTSPFVRAKQTADIIANVFQLQKKVRETDTLSTSGDPEELIRLVQSGGDEFQSVLLVGHEPFLSDLISVLLVGDSSLVLTMKKGGLCKLRVGIFKYGRCASLEWLIPPSISVQIK